MSVPESYEVFAVRYATMTNRWRHDNFIGVDPHDDPPMPIDFYVWVIRNANRTIVVEIVSTVNAEEGSDGRIAARKISFF